MPQARPASSVTAVCLAYRLRGADADTIADAYQLIAGGAAPLIVLAAARMLPDLRADAAAGHRIMFVGRDGHALAAAVRGLDRDFFAAACSEVVLSRALAEAAVQDLEVNAGQQFGQLAGFRQAAARVPARHVTGSFRALTAYLNRCAVPAGVPGAAVTVVDNGLKGTIQELLAALYPQTVFRGRYLVHLPAPGDPHPGTKQGYLVHRSGPGWSGLPLPSLPADPALTFACRDGVKVLEDTLHGTMASPLAWSAAGRPRQRPQRLIRRQLTGLNPALVSPRYTRPEIREAVKAAALLAVYDTAARAARARATGQPPDIDLTAAARRFTADVRAWIAGRPPADAGLGELLDSFVRRTDQDINRRLARAARRAGLTPEAEARLWQHLAAIRPPARRQAAAARVLARLTGRGEPPASVAPLMTGVHPRRPGRPRYGPARPGPAEAAQRRPYR